MIEPRLAAGLLVAALRRRIEAEGGVATVLARGDDVAGAILLLLADRGESKRIVERVWRFEGGHGLDGVGPAEPAEMEDYLARRRRADPDLWAVEIDHPEAHRIAGEILL